MSAHTKTPWHVYDSYSDDRYPGIDAVGSSIVIFGCEDDETGVRGSTPEESFANAAFICRAVNAHDDLVAALKDLLDMCMSNGDFRNGVTDHSGSSDEGEYFSGLCFDRARRALTKAAQS